MRKFLYMHCILLWCLDSESVSIFYKLKVDWGKSYCAQMCLIIVFYSACGFLKIKYYFFDKMAGPTCAQWCKTLPLKINNQTAITLWKLYYSLLDYNNHSEGEVGKSFHNSCNRWLKSLAKVWHLSQSTEISVSIISRLLYNNR